MKTTFFCVLISVSAFFGVVEPVLACGPSSYGQRVCATNPTYPYVSPSPLADRNAVVTSPIGAANVAPTFAPQILPQSRFTVVPSTSVPRTLLPTTPVIPENVGAVHVIPITDSVEALKVAPKAEPAASKPAESTASSNAAPPKEENSPIADELKGLVGTWMAVARHGDGELTTIELQLDSRGWAKLTVPSANGKPSTITRRVELNDKELKLTGPDGALALGKLVEFNSRQMVLDRADGQVTFVRP